MKILSVDKDKAQVELTREELSVLVGSTYHGVPIRRETIEGRPYIVVPAPDEERGLRDLTFSKFEETFKRLQSK